MSDDARERGAINRHVYSSSGYGDERWFVPRIVAVDHVRGILLTPMNRTAPVAAWYSLPVPIPAEWTPHEVDTDPSDS